MLASASRTVSPPRSVPARNFWLTLSSASSGQALNQSMVVQLMSEGNCRQRARKASPTGLIASTKWRLSRTRLTKAV